MLLFSVQKKYSEASADALAQYKNEIQKLYESKKISWEALMT
jgi:hypothetical protein